LNSRNWDHSTNARSWAMNLALVTPITKKLIIKKLAILITKKLAILITKTLIILITKKLIILVTKKLVILVIKKLTITINKFFKRIVYNIS